MYFNVNSIDLYPHPVAVRGFRVSFREVLAAGAGAGGELFPYPNLGGSGNIDIDGSERVVHRYAGQHQSDDCRPSCQCREHCRKYRLVDGRRCAGLWRNRVQRYCDCDRYGPVFRTCFFVGCDIFQVSQESVCRILACRYARGVRGKPDEEVLFSQC